MCLRGNEDVTPRRAISANAPVSTWSPWVCVKTAAAILDQVAPTLSSRSPMALGPMPTSINNPAPRPRTKVEFPRDPLASTAN